MMDWLAWLLLVLALMGVFVAWDLVFCGGRRCRALVDRMPLLRPGDVGRTDIDPSSAKRPPPKDDTPG